jgi:YesN/AraC family two-component response regulator
MYRVYIVDDEPLMVSRIIETVSWEENGFEVAGSGTNPASAIEEILRINPDLVFCDLKMPELGGVSLVRRLREAGANCEFVMISAFAEFEATRDFFRLDGFDYLLKPLDPLEADMVLEKVSRKLGSKRNAAPTLNFTPSPSKSFDDLVGYVTENYNKKHTLSSLSRRFGLSESYICNLFSKHYNSTLRIFITDARMKQAERRISGSDQSLKEIAVDCGYNDYFYFCRVFKAYFGIPPTEYREHSAAGETP